MICLPAAPSEAVTTVGAADEVELDQLEEETQVEVDAQVDLDSQEEAGVVCSAGQSVTVEAQEVTVTKVDETSVSVKVSADTAAAKARMATVENCIAKE